MFGRGRPRPIASHPILTTGRALRHLLRLWRTVRHLRPEQSFGRPAYELRRRVHNRALTLGMLDRDPAPVASVGLRLDFGSADREASKRGCRVLLEGKALIAGHDVLVTDWNRTALPKLVRYHLHYLDPVRALVAATREQPVAASRALGLAHRWSTENSTGAGEGWEPYPVASRLQNLSILAAQLGPSAPDWLGRLIVTHCRYLERWPETHLQGNHLLKDWLSLAIGGLLLDGPEAPAWRDRGMRETRLQFQEQLLADGGHYERSPMYHALILSDLLDLRDFAGARGAEVPWLRPAISAMARFLAGILHPDGEIPLFNDAVIGQAPDPTSILVRADETPVSTERVFDAPEFGLTVIRSNNDDFLAFDTGALGPLHQPGHAHSDTLSFELSIAGERRVVNAGMDGYQSPNRPLFRSAAAHNTVTVNNEGPDELWASFRVGGRNQVTSRSHRALEGHYQLSGSLRAFQRWTQHRTLAFFPGKLLVVVDDVAVPKAGEVVSRARIAPGTSPLQFRVLLGDHQSGKALYAPHFGEVREIDEHRARGSGKRVRLAYALIWGSGEIQINAVETARGVEVIVDVDGARHRVRSESV